MVFAQIKGLEGEMKPLKDGVQSLTSQKDALLAEKTALKNEAAMRMMFTKTTSGQSRKLQIG